MAESYIPAEAQAEGRSVIVEALVRTGFADLPIFEQKRRAEIVLNHVMERMFPELSAAYRVDVAAGTSPIAAEKRLDASMHATCAVVQDALRECGLDIEIVPVQLPGDRRG